MFSWGSHYISCYCWETKRLYSWKLVWSVNNKVFTENILRNFKRRRADMMLRETLRSYIFFDTHHKSSIYSQSLLRQKTKTNTISARNVSHFLKRCCCSKFHSKTNKKKDIWECVCMCLSQKVLRLEMNKKRNNKK